MTAGPSYPPELVQRAQARAWLDAFVAAHSTSLLAFIPKVSPKYQSPHHLAPFVTLLERCRTERVRAVISTPPRHGKSETVLHFIVQCLLLDPTDSIAYVTYGAEFSQQQAAKALRIANRAGLKLDVRRANYWSTPQGGFVDWNSVGGQLTGKGFRKLLIDDPVKDREEADSPTYRNKAWEWCQDVALTRVEPGGSAMDVQTRWHPDDMAGRLILEGWERINLKAIDDDGRALWPERWPVEALAEHRAQAYKWASLYQGEPRPRGAAVFRDPTYYDVGQLPKSGVRISIGADFAYTKKSYADYSSAVVLHAEHGDRGKIYVVEVKREQVEAPAFAKTLTAVQARHAAKIAAYIGGTERGVVDFMKQAGLRMDPMPAVVDKFARAQPVAAAWNAGRVMVPRPAEGKPSPAWLAAFLDELGAFTGVDDPHDDQVDALAAAFDVLNKPRSVRLEVG